MCELCQKKCKSKSGLKRHKTAKHKEEHRQDEVEQQRHDFTVQDFISLSTKAQAKILENKVYPQSVRDELISYSFNISSSSTEFCEVKKMYERLIKSGNAEKFYSNFYPSIVLNSTKVFEGLSRHAATLLTTKVADCMLAQTKERFETIITDPPPKLSERETAGLQYVGGYVPHKLYNMHKNKKSRESEQTASILKAGKVENHNDMENQKLTSSLNRGGLWSISKYSQLIFERIEHHFRIVTSRSLHNIDISIIESRSVCDIQLVSAYDAMLSESELIADKSIAKDALHNIVYLYVKVRCFSFAKDVIQKHKINSKQLKEKALRKEICRASKENEIERQS